MCSRGLGDVSKATDENAEWDSADEERPDIYEELASVRRQLTEATNLVGSLHNRVTGLEARISRDVVARRPEPSAVAEARSERTGAQQPAASASAVSAYSAEAVVEKPDTLQVDQVRIESPEIGLRIDWEQVLGRNWFAIIGGVAVVLGIGFFLKLAFDNNWIGDTGRIALGIVVGLGFLGVGEYAQRRVPRWAQSVTASGAAILYLSIYAAFGLYQLIRPDAAFLLLAVVVAAAALLALRYESIVIALLGVAGAFLSPVLLGTDLPDVRLVTVYILLVDVGILAISTFRNWRWLTLVGLVASYGIFGYWLSEFPGHSPLTTYIVLTGVFLTFAAATPLFHILWRRMPGVSDLSLMSINASVYFLLTTIVLLDDYEGWFGLIAFSLALFYGLMALAAFKRSGTPARVAVFALAIASVFLTMGVPLQFSGYSVAVSWVAQGVAMVWMGFYLRRWQLRAFGLAVLSLAVCHLILFDIWVDEEGYSPVLNGRFPTMVVVTAAFYAVGFIYWRNRAAGGLLNEERWAATFMIGVANLVSLGLISLEIVNYLYRDSLAWTSIFDIRMQNFGNGTHLSLTVAWAVYGSSVAAVGLLRRLPIARWGGLALLGAAVLKLLTYDAFYVHMDLLSFTPLLNIRFMAFAVILGLLSAFAFWYRRSQSRLTEQEGYIFPALLIAGNVVALWMVSQEIIHYFDALAARYDSDYFNAKHLSLTVAWAVYGSSVAAVGLLRQLPTARWGGLALLGAAVLKLLTYDAFYVHMDLLSFTPLLNIRFMAFAVMLGLLSAFAFWFKRSQSRLTEREGYIFPALLISANVVALWMVSQEIIHYFDALAARYDSDYFSAKHLSLTVLWAVYSVGMIGAGIVYHSSRIRLAGIGLLAIPVAKLFVYDVFLLEMAYRVVAFLTLGCLLLSMGLVYQRYSHAVRGFLFGRGLTT